MGDVSMLSLTGFELTDSPRSSQCAASGMGTPVPRFNFEDFAEASPMQNTYCKQLSEDDYQMQTMTETEKALQNLVSYIENDPKVIAQLLQKRKQEEIENAGFVSYLKARFMKKLQGDRYSGDSVSESECRDKLEEITNGMMMVYNYSQESKGRRFSKRLAAKQRQRGDPSSSPVTSRSSHSRLAQAKTPANSQTSLDTVRTYLPPHPPPPPPCPPPQMTVLREKTNVMTSPFPDVDELKRKPLRLMRSSSSISSVHQELLATNPVQRLRSTRQHRSPGGTPVKRKRTRLDALKATDPNTSSDSLGYENPLNSSEPLASAFLRIMEQKFRNVRSPSPAPHSPSTPGNTTFEFSP